MSGELRVEQRTPEQCTWCVLSEWILNWAIFVFISGSRRHIPPPPIPSVLFICIHCIILYRKKIHHKHCWIMCGIALSIANIKWKQWALVYLTKNTFFARHLEVQSLFCVFYLMVAQRLNGYFYIIYYCKFASGAVYFTFFIFVCSTHRILLSVSQCRQVPEARARRVNPAEQSIL